MSTSPIHHPPIFNDLPTRHPTNSLTHQRCSSASTLGFQNATAAPTRWRTSRTVSASRSPAPRGTRRSTTILVSSRRGGTISRQLAMYVWAPLTHLLSSSPSRTPHHQLKRTITTPLLTLLPHLTTPGTRVLSQGASAVAGSQGAQCVAQVRDDHGEETEHFDRGPLRRLPASVR
jgi:hypothetical protein